MDEITVLIWDEKKFLKKGIITKKLIADWRDFAEERSAFCITPDNIIVLRRPKYIHNDTIEKEIEWDIEHETLHIILCKIGEDKASFRLDDFKAEAFMRGYTKGKDAT